MNAEIPEAIRAKLLGFGMQIPELFTQRKFVLAACHTHFDADKLPKIAIMNAYISETIKDRELGFQI